MKVDLTRRATIYGRRSKDKQEESVPRQVENARKFIDSQGWTEAEVIFTEEGGCSRAEFVRRPRLTAMIAAAKQKQRPFDIVVVRDETRLGGDMLRTTLAIQDLIEAGIEVWYYNTKERVQLESATDKAMVTFRNMASEFEREKCVSRSYEASLQRFEHGYVTGGKTYGYDNVPAPDGSKHKVHAINAAEAKVVLLMWTLYTEGHGQRSIAVHLNEQGIPAPRIGKRGTGSWSPSCVREILFRDLYVGVDQFNRYQKVVRGGTRCREERPETEWIRKDFPDLRIIPADIEAMVRARRDANEESKSWRNPGGKPVHLISGMARCSLCGGPVSVGRGWKGQSPAPVYQCNYHRDRGDTVCSNAVRRPTEDVNEAVLGLLEERALRDEIAGEVVAELRLRMSATDTNRGGERQEVQASIHQVQAEAANLRRMAATVCDDEDVQRDLLQELRIRKNRERELLARLDNLNTAPAAIAKELGRLELEVKKRLTGLRSALRGQPNEARRVLEALLAGPIEVTPVGPKKGGKFRLRMKLRSHSALLCPVSGVPNGI